jgi:hypothetical protein
VWARDTVPGGNFYKIDSSTMTLVETIPRGVYSTIIGEPVAGVVAVYGAAGDTYGRIGIMV